MTLSWEDQPARQIMKDQKRKVTRTAVAMGIPYLRLQRTLEGRTHPCEVTREKLPEILGVPLEQLFDAQSLAKPFNYKIPQGMGCE